MTDLRDLFGIDGDRRDFFRQSFGQWAERLLEKTEERIVRGKYFRPPGALPEVAFLAACTRCGAGTDVWPPHAIPPHPTRARRTAGTPAIDPKLQPGVA